MSKAPKPLSHEQERAALPTKTRLTLEQQEAQTKGHLSCVGGHMRMEYAAGRPRFKGPWLELGPTKTRKQRAASRR